MYGLGGQVKGKPARSGICVQELNKRQRLAKGGLSVMAIIKGRSDGGSGGKRGHSNMNHWMHTEEIKSAARKTRRLEAKAAIKAEVADLSKGR